jgi:C4-dicarboxylate-specific signal transduction histidine kinase
VSAREQAGAATRTRRLVQPFALLLALSVLLQVASLVGVQRIGASRVVSRETVAVADTVEGLVERYQSATYLALVGLSVSDWEMLIQQRSKARELTARFEQVARALRQGGQPAPGAEVVLPGTDEPASVRAIEESERAWRAMEQAHVGILRSDNRSLKGNPALEQFQRLSLEAIERSEALEEVLRHAADEDVKWLITAQRAIPVCAFALIMVIGVFVLSRLIVPLGASMESLAKSEGELRVARDDLERRVIERTAELAAANEGLREAEEALRRSNEDLERRVKERTRELKEAQGRAVSLARQAGMMEVATNVLHNVGNVLHSVNTSAAMLTERLRASRLPAVGKAAALLEEQGADLGAFFARDPRGRQLPAYLSKLGEHLAAERDELLEVLETLNRHIDHIRAVVNLQQSYARSTDLLEPVQLRDLIEDALRINAAALGRHEVSVERHFAEMEPVLIDKHKALQILINLISNAKYALDGGPAEARRITLRVERAEGDRVRVQVSDNGVGIAPEVLPRIFQQGFPTRAEGHGFGLHASALAAQAMGGSLSAHSDGPGHGATFTLEFPASRGMAG